MKRAKRNRGAGPCTSTTLRPSAAAGRASLYSGGGKISKPFKLTWLWLKTNGIPFWGRCTHLSILVYLSGDWEVHWGYDLDFDPWPNAEIAEELCNLTLSPKRRAEPQKEMPASPVLPKNSQSVDYIGSVKVRGTLRQGVNLIL